MHWVRSATWRPLVVAVMAAIPFLLTVMPSNVALGGTQFTVNNTHDEVDATAGDGLCQSASGSCTLRAAIMEANALPGADTIVLPVGLYRMEVPAGQVDEDSDSSGDFDITDDVSIRGSGKDSTKILGCGGTYGLLCGLYRAFEVAPGVSANVSGLMVISASTRDVGGAFENYGTLTLSEVLIESTNGAFGAGVYNHVGASLRMTNSRLVNGGSLIGLSNLRGAGLYNEGVADLVGDVFERNQATEHGGGIYNSGTITVRDSTLIGNSARFTGGGLGNFGTAGVSETNFVGNVTANVGGGISNSGTMIVSGSSIRSNIAAHSNVALTGLEGGGGGIGQLGGSLELSSTTVSGNLAYAGGGLSVLYPLGHPIRGSTFSGNTAATDGGGIYTVFELSLENSTLSGNSAQRGAGLFNDGQASLDSVHLRGVTVAGNDSSVAGGGLYNGGALDVINTIVAESPHGNNCFGSVTSLGHNLDSDGSCALKGSGDLSAIDPELGMLRDNGGPTVTHALESDSPAVDHGDNASCLPEDQRGIIRPMDGDGDGVGVCDIGAYEAATAVTPPGVTFRDLRDLILRLDSHDLKGIGHRNIMVQSVNDAEGAATTDPYAAVGILVGLRDHANGCGDQPDISDWIINCEPQITIRAAIEALISSLAH